MTTSAALSRFGFRAVFHRRIVGGMIVSSSVMRCRYLAAPGTGTDASFPFGDHLKSHEIQLPDDCSLDYMVRAGWISPILRVPLSRAALEAWENFPKLPTRGTEGCSAEDSWSLDLWDKALATPWPQTGQSPSWWQHFLDDAANPLGVMARAHAIDPSDESLRPAAFVHPRTGKEVRPWMDFFADWQAYQVAELLASATRMYRVTPGFDVRVAANANATLEWVAKFAVGIRKKWEARRPTFEWLLRFRTILAAGMERWGEVENAARGSAEEQGLTTLSTGC
jgi:hypothetical protein